MMKGKQQHKRIFKWLIIVRPFFLISLKKKKKKVSRAWEFVYWAFVVSVVLFNLGLVILLHRRPAIDNFGCREELTWYFIIIIMWTGPTLPVLLAVIENSWEQGAYVMVVVSGIVTSLDVYIMRLAIRYATNNPQMLNGSRGDSVVNLMNETNNENENGLTLIDVMKNDAGLSLFAAYLVREYAHESILFLLEVFQFRKQFKHLTKVREDDSPEFHISDHVPKCRTLTDNPENFYKQAECIRDRFIPYSSNLCINISSAMRKDLENINFNELELEDLAIVFDDAFKRIFALLRDPFLRFRETYEYKALVKESKPVATSSSSSLALPTVEHSRQISQDININLFHQMENQNDDKIHYALKIVGDCFENCCTSQK
ncbi:hypothetical protein RFI_36882 [Reticulomyxa filosa]|uniref:RGS domain-containing protein n=1 Tax=Reticulomyxa filosa TaxID=46433 RepID=X6LGQ7_RETFI|nr:hypothetical protein RFI_36882 [Reticulomyxa filosa]|eukprot:ETO00556.1 hypothetical protein RFI_36882 [Reticulomyxa filosa]